jgi:hypothetical protein
MVEEERTAGFMTEELKDYFTPKLLDDARFYDLIYEVQAKSPKHKHLKARQEALYAQVEEKMGKQFRADLAQIQSSLEGCDSSEVAEVAFLFGKHLMAFALEADRLLWQWGRKKPTYLDDNKLPKPKNLQSPPAAVQGGAN